MEGINVHRYGAHIFHTNNKAVWQYVNQFAEFNRYTNSPVANYHGEIYNLPFNMNTFNKMWGVVTPAEAKAKIEEQRPLRASPSRRIWRSRPSVWWAPTSTKSSSRATPASSGAAPAPSCRRSSSSACRCRFTYDNNYFNAAVSGHPQWRLYRHGGKDAGGRGGALNVDYLADKEQLDALADKVVYTGPVDAYFGYRLGALQYRSVRFETEVLDTDNYQGNAVVNYTDAKTPTPASSSTSTLSSARSPRRSSAGSTAPSGNRATNPIIPSTTRRTAPCTPSTRHWPMPSERDLRRPPGRV